MTNESLAPIVLFCYDRPDRLRRTVESLAANNLASESQLFIFSDGPKTIDDESNVAQVRNYISTVSGFKKVELILAPYNKGLATSIISGVSTVLNQFEKTSYWKTI